MTIVNLLFPVFFMMGLGFVARRLDWITPAQKDGTKNTVFGIFFPILIFNVIFTSTFDPSSFLMIGYVAIFWVLTIFIARRFLRKWHGEKFADVAAFMLTTSEGGSVALPLYTAIVGMEYAINTVTFDLAGVLLAFVIIPILVARLSASDVSQKDLFKKVITNPFVLAVLFGLLLNILGGADLLQNLGLFEIYSSTITMATGGIVGLILFTIGYDFSLSADVLQPVLRLMITRIVLSFIIIGGFFLLFPNVMADPIFLVAILIYFFSPTGFATPLQLQPLYKSPLEESYASTVLSVYMVVTLIVYILVVMFIAV